MLSNEGYFWELSPEKRYLLKLETLRVRSGLWLLVSALAVLIALKRTGVVSAERTPLRNEKVKKEVSEDCSGEPGPSSCGGWGRRSAPDF